MYLFKLLFSFAMVIFVQSSSANAACVMKFVATDALWSVLNKHEFNFEKYDLICKKVNEANARVMISGGFFNFDSVKVATITVQLVDRDAMIISNGYHQINVTVDSRVKSRSKDTMISLAINRALGEWTALDDAIKDLNYQRRLLNK